MKSGSGKMNKIERAHQMYRDGKYEEALRFYTEALSIAKFNPQKIALHSNRAACFLKLHQFKKAADECTSVLELDHNHTGALMLRAQTLVTLKEYHSALFDVNRLIELNPSSEVYQNLEARLKTQLSLAPIPEAETELEEEDEESSEDVEELEENEEDRKEDHEDEEGNEDGKYVSIGTGGNQIEEPKMLSDPVAEVSAPQTVDDHKAERRITTTEKESPEECKAIPKPKGPEQWKAIPKPKGHSRLDYSRWDSVEDDSSDDEDADDEEESQPQYRFRVRTVGVRQVK